MKSVVVIPAYNEGKVIAEVINDIKKHQFNDVIVVDDGSSDDTYEIVKRIDGKIIALRHRINLGKGAALKTGCEAAIKLGADIIVFMDSDGQHKPEDISRFIEKLEKDNLDIVFGSRRIGKDMPLVMML
ncbi:MAG: glycosyltransferase family 2 protein, partial [Patescibacteria group bacterium]